MVIALDWTTIAREQPALKAIPNMLRNAVRRQPFTAGQTLYHRGARPSAMLYVLAGEIRLVRRTAGGAEIILQRARAGFVAEASLESKVYHCDMIAATDGWFLLFLLSAFRAALDNNPLFNRAWIGHLSSEVRRLRAQNERLNQKSAAKRVLHYLEAEGADGAVTLTQIRKAWAAELGMTHEALYRTLHTLRENRTPVVDGDRIALMYNRVITGKDNQPG